MLLFFLITSYVAICNAQNDTSSIRCKYHEVYKSCGTPCQATCDYRYPLCPYQPCVPGCFCVNGYVRRTPKGLCIKIENCPDSPCNGDSYAVWVKCPNPCPPTCQHPYPPVCKRMCPNWGCQCKKGYILNEVNKKCVSPKDCPDNQ